MCKKMANNNIFLHFFKKNIKNVTKYYTFAFFLNIKTLEVDLCKKQVNPFHKLPM